MARPKDTLTSPQDVAAMAEGGISYDQLFDQIKGGNPAEIAEAIGRTQRQGLVEFGTRYNAELGTTETVVTKVVED